MIIMDFTHAHIPQATALAFTNYEEERRCVPSLPLVNIIPDLTPFAKNNLGVVALENGQLLGFLCFYTPWDNAFNTRSKGTFFPIHGHGTVKEHREHIYKRMYQVAAQKLVNCGVSSHAVSLYAHDQQALNAFFTYGFGLRCIDAIRPMEVIPVRACSMSIYSNFELISFK